MPIESEAVQSINLKDVDVEQQLRLEDATYYLAIEQDLAALHKKLRVVHRGSLGGDHVEVTEAIEVALYRLGDACLAASSVVSSLRA